MAMTTTNSLDAITPKLVPTENTSYMRGIAAIPPFAKCRRAPRRYLAIGNLQRTQELYWNAIGTLNSTTLVDKARGLWGHTNTGVYPCFALRAAFLRARLRMFWCRLATYCICMECGSAVSPAAMIA